MGESQKTDGPFCDKGTKPYPSTDAPQGDFSAGGTVEMTLGDDGFSGAANAIVDDDAARKTPYGEILTPGTPKWEEFVEVHEKDTIPGEQSSFNPVSSLEFRLYELDKDPQNKRAVFAICQIHHHAPEAFEGMEAYVLERLQDYEPSKIEQALTNQIAEVMSALQKVVPAPEPEEKEPEQPEEVEEKDEGNEIDWTLKDLGENKSSALRRLLLIYTNKTKRFFFEGREQEVLDVLARYEFEKTVDLECLALLTTKLKGEEPRMADTPEQETQKDGTLDQPAASTTAPRLGGRQASGAMVDSTEQEPTEGRESDQPEGSLQPPPEEQTHVVAAAAIKKLDEEAETKAPSPWELWKRQTKEIMHHRAFERYSSAWINSLLKVFGDPEHIRLLEMTEYIHDAAEDTAWKGLLVAGAGDIRVYLKINQVRVEDDESAEEYQLSLIEEASSKEPFTLTDRNGKKINNPKIVALSRYLYKRPQSIFGLKRTAGDLADFIAENNPSTAEVAAEFWSALWVKFRAAGVELTSEEMIPDNKDDFSFWKEVSLLAEVFPEGTWLGFPFLEKDGLSMRYQRGTLNIVFNEKLLAVDLLSNQGAEEAQNILHEIAEQIIMDLPLAMDDLKNMIAATCTPQKLEEMLTQALKSVS